LNSWKHLLRVQSACSGGDLKKVTLGPDYALSRGRRGKGSDLLEEERGKGRISSKRCKGAFLLFRGKSQAENQTSVTEGEPKGEVKLPNRKKKEKKIFILRNTSPGDLGRPA